MIGQSAQNNKTAIYGVEISGDGGTTWKRPNSGDYTRTFTHNYNESHTLGGSSDDWGWASEGWDGDNCSNSNFSLRIWNTTTGARVPLFEQIQVTVYYTAPSFTQAIFRGRDDDADED